MKTITIILVVLVVLFVLLQILVSRSTNKTEGHAYKVLKEYEKFEVREYEPALFSYTVIKSKTYKDASSRGFRTLAGYIFGGNDKKQKISMTSPVSMTMSDSMTMKFKVPDGIDMDELPKPISGEVQFRVEPVRIMAAMRFKGSVDDEKLSQEITKFKNLLKENNIDHFGNFSYLGYNPPYQVVSRRNEIVVDVEFKP